MLIGQIQIQVHMKYQKPTFMKYRTGELILHKLGGSTVNPDQPPPRSLEITDPEPIPFPRKRVRTCRELEIWCDGDEPLQPKFGWLYKDAIPRVGVGILAGPSQHYKSYLELNTIASIILGLSYAGVEMEPGMQGAGLVFCAERNNPIEQRWDAVKQAVAAPYFDSIGEKIKTLPFYVTRRVPLLTDKTAYEQITEIIESVQNDIKQRGFDCQLRYVSYDTIGKSTLFKDGNSGSENQPIMNLMDRISFERQLFFNAVDHLGKDETKGIIGPIVKYNSADVIRFVKGTKTGNEKPTNLQVVGDKVRGGRGSICAGFEMVPVQLTAPDYIDSHGNGTNEITVRWTGQPGQEKKRAPIDPRNISAKKVLRVVLDVIHNQGYWTALGADWPNLKVIDLKNAISAFVMQDRETEDKKSDKKRSENRWRKGLASLLENKTLGQHVLENGEVFLWNPQEASVAPLRHS
jgi:hypothetical protein